ncbi:MAG: S9 family peptidase [Adhaeribacter sp.]
MRFPIKTTLLWVMLAASSLAVEAQQKKEISLTDIYQRRTFPVQTVSGVNWMKDGRYYSSELADKANQVTDIVRYDVLTGKAVGTIIEGEHLLAPGNPRPIAFDDYSFSADEQKVLFATEKESIYRRSSKANFFVYDRATKKLSPLSAGGKQMYATFSPDGSKVAFARDNNMFVVDLATRQETPITRDGKFNETIHGYADWVYEEEFSFAQGFAWSPDGARIAFYTFDESRVPEYNMQVWGPLYPIDYKFKYPKAGEANSVVSVSVYELATGKTLKMDTGQDPQAYLPRMKWTADPKLLSIQRLNRLQNHFELLHVNATTGQATVVLQEKDPAYVEITDDLTYTADGKAFIHSSEKSGYNHLYLYQMNGKLLRQITRGNWEVSSFVGFDEKGKRLYFLSTENSPMERHLYSIAASGKGKKRLTAQPGVHRVNMSPDFTYYLDYRSATLVPNVVSLNQARDGKLVKELEANRELQASLQNYQLAPQEFFSFQTPEGTSLNGWMIKPANFDAGKKYPVLMYVYGGPGSQEVLDEWGGSTFLWFQHLASKGLIVACVDNRGTGGRGAAFKKSTYAQLGKYEIEDQIAAAKYLGQQAFVDAARIGIWGHSFGGYMTLLGLTKGQGIFRAGIAVAPVTNWRFYDTVYTERYLKTPQDNAAGYDQNSPLTFAKQMKGHLLLIHGTGDDNVHFQNAVAMQDALIAANKQFESFYYPNRNHGIGGGNTLLHRFTLMTDFLERNLIQPQRSTAE